ncbi:MAG: lysophospholipase [Lentimicrobiaceae bacterium]|jgi:alpha-beta hydrolase superfamily lysophospholipase
MQHFETNWKSNDGIDIFAQGWESENSAPKAVVCLVHGLGEHTSRYEHVAKAYSDKGCALFGADLRGHGRSGGRRGHIPSIEAVMNDIDLLLEKANDRYPGLPLILYGHSLGGILVLHYGLKRKPKVKGVIATSSGLRTALEKQPAKILAAKVLGAVIPKVTLPSGLEVNAISHDKKVIDKYINDPLVHDKVSLGFGKIMLNTAQWTLQHSAGFSLPLLLLHGKADAIAFPLGSIEFAAPLKEKCMLVLFDDAYHELHNEPEQETVFNTMTNWMDSLLLVKQ